eukprot:gene22706-29863_t
MDNSLAQRMPFLTQWKEATKGKHSRDTGWDSLLQKGGGDVYVKGSVQGKAVYTLKCQELGVVPSTQGSVQGKAVYALQCQELGVMPSTQVGLQQLPREIGAHVLLCQLGIGEGSLKRVGGQALVCNQTITSLDLKANAIDSVAVAEIIRGLTSGLRARVTNKERETVENKYNSLSWLQGVRHLLYTTDAKNGTPFELKPSESDDAEAQAMAGRAAQTTGSGARITMMRSSDGGGGGGEDGVSDGGGGDNRPRTPPTPLTPCTPTTGAEALANTK